MERKHIILTQDNSQPWPVIPESVHLVFGSPPYFGAAKKIHYDVHDYEPSLIKWTGALISVTASAYRSLAPGGRMVVNVANSGRKPYYDLAGIVQEVMQREGFTPRGQIIWDKGANVMGTAWGSWKSASAPSIRDQHEYLVVGQKSPTPEAERLSVSGFSRREFEDKDFESLTASIWRVNPESAQRIGHPAPFPVELARRVIRLYTRPGMTVLDPWLGSGTTMVAAAEEDCASIGIEISKGYSDIARRRIIAAQQGVTK